jgi:two-component system, response regulator RegA
MTEKENSESILLIAEDDAVFQNRLFMTLKKRNIKCRGASSSEEALHIAKETNIKWGIIDLRLGNDCGLTLLKRLLVLHPDASLIILTGYGTISTAVEAMKHGALHYLTKPPSIAEILEILGLSEKTFEKSASEQRVIPSLQQVQWEHIQNVLNVHNRNVTKASQALGLPRRSLQRKLKKDPGKLV